MQADSSDAQVEAASPTTLVSPCAPCRRRLRLAGPPRRRFTVKNAQMATLRSLRSLDWLNFFLANVQTGFGPFIASYLATNRWTQGEIGVALSVGTATAMLSQVPAGALLDAIRNKKAAGTAAILAIAACALLLAVSPTLLPVIAAEVFHGFVSSMLTPAIAAISFALVGRRALGDRLGRNARFASIGSAVAAALMGAVGEYSSARSVFWLTAALTVPALFALSMIEPTRTIAHDQNASHAERGSIGELLRDKRVLVFGICIALFHLSNAAMLNLAAGEVTTHMSDDVQLVIAACIILPQIVAAALSPWVGRSAERWGRRPLLILGFAALPVRALLFAGISNPYLFAPAQVFDGLSAAVFGVMLPLIAADVAASKGHYNFCIGLFGLTAGIGATVSTLAAGFVADRYGNTISFLCLAAAGALAVLLVWVALPETRNAETGDDAQ